MKVIRLMGLLMVALFVVSAVKADSIDPMMVVGGAGGCGTPSVVSTFSLNANANGGSDSTACPGVTGSVFKNGTGSTITSITVTTTDPTNPCGFPSTFSGRDLFTTGACSYDPGTQVATVVFSGMGPCGGSIDIAVSVTCAGIAPGADFFVSLGTSGWVPFASFNGSVTAPEPTSLTLLLGGIGLLGFLRRSWKPAA